MLYKKKQVFYLAARSASINLCNSNFIVYLTKEPTPVQPKNKVKLPRSTKQKQQFINMKVLQSDQT
jgi:hypothetical protein